MNQIKHFFLLLLLAATLQSAGQTKKQDRIDEEYEQCLRKDTSYTGVSNCSFEAYGKWNKEMTKTYNKLISKLKTEKNKAAMKQSQKAWLTYRDAEFNSYNYMFNQPGNKWDILRQQGRIEIVRERTLQLRDYLESITGH
jgi:uncharacterized protein YecT (DUF1311 family)